jgi:hypothetical protein
MKFKIQTTPKIGIFVINSLSINHKINVTYALQTGSPSLLRLHRVVVVVPQFVQHNPIRLDVACVKQK